MHLEIQKNREAPKYSRSEMFRRVQWTFGQGCFRFTLRPWFGWRRFILRRFGAGVGREVHIYSSAIIYFPWNLRIGDWSSIGEGALIYIFAPARMTTGSRTCLSSSRPSE